jgi:phosphoribosylformylglycinamidine synthase
MLRLWSDCFVKESGGAMLWEVDICPAPGEPDRQAARVREEAEELGLAGGLQVASAYGYLLEGALSEAEVRRLARDVLADPVVEQACVGQVGEQRLLESALPEARLVYVLPKPGVMDPVAETALAVLREQGWDVRAVRTLRKYWLSGLDEVRLAQLCQKLLANLSIEEVVYGPLRLERLSVGAPYTFQLVTVPLAGLDAAGLERLSRERTLYLSVEEMQAIQGHFLALGRAPTDVELETVAQSWSEHCCHKTLSGPVVYRDGRGERRFENLLRETVFAATEEIRRRLGADDWCVSVFRDNAGVVRFDGVHHLVFKVETHNHPSAIEPYGGANTGVGGVIRDALGTGLGARPICNTDVFCFAPPELSHEQLPPGVLHPRRVMKGVVAGVRDYGNRMGIPTVSGAVYFDPRYLANPLVYCGTVGLLPHDRVEKGPRSGDWVVVVGGRTGRDGIHGATFSSAELTSASEAVSGGAVQIGNAITQKKMLDVLLAARDRGLYHAITDCGAGGFSSAVGEMGAELGAVVWLERAPLKYQGLSYAEIWISEAQERMVLAVPPQHWPELEALCRAEDVEATIIGRFGNEGRLRLEYQGRTVADLSMEFLHHGRPRVVRQAVYAAPPERPLVLPSLNAGDALLQILGSLNVASKEWIIRQYDHEVQGASVIKPLVGAANDGPSDAAVLRPVLGARRGIAVACGMNPRYGDLDPYHMAASAIDEAVRNCVAVGADPRRIALLDNFCWGNTARPETLGTLVRAALGLHDTAVALGTPFISGKDSLNNEFHYLDEQGRQRALSIPPSLLVSALGQLEDVALAVSMDLKRAGNLLYLVGATADELGGSHLALVAGLEGGAVPKVEAAAARCLFTALHAAMVQGLVRACHDLSEGGLAVALAEMAFAGGLGATVDLRSAPRRGWDAPGSDTAYSPHAANLVLLFSESNSRFLCEVEPERAAAFESVLQDVPYARLGTVSAAAWLEIWGFSAHDRPELVLRQPIDQLKEAWQRPLRW